MPACGLAASASDASRHRRCAIRTVGLKPTATGIPPAGTTHFTVSQSRLTESAVAGARFRVALAAGTGYIRRAVKGNTCWAYSIFALVLCGLNRPGVAATPDASAAETPPPVEIVISVKDQRLAVVENGGLVKKYPISTSKFGLGDRYGSYQTPLGELKVCDKIGGDLPAGAVIKHRSATGEVLPANAAGRDPIVTRILWLDGQEERNVNARSRGIYIHGTVEENRLGEPVSYGCIRMRSRDVIEVFEETPLGTPVRIVEEKLPRFHKPAPVKPEVILVNNDRATPTPAPVKKEVAKIEVAKLEPVAERPPTVIAREPVPEKRPSARTEARPALKLFGEKSVAANATPAPAQPTRIVRAAKVPPGAVLLGEAREAAPSKRGAAASSEPVVIMRGSILFSDLQPKKPARAPVEPPPPLSTAPPLSLNVVPGETSDLFLGIVDAEAADVPLDTFSRHLLEAPSPRRLAFRTAAGLDGPAVVHAPRRRAPVEEEQTAEVAVDQRTETTGAGTSVLRR